MCVAAGYMGWLRLGGAGGRWLAIAGGGWGRLGWYAGWWYLWLVDDSLVTGDCN